MTLAQATNLRRALVATGEFEVDSKDGSLRYAIPADGGTVIIHFDPLGGFLSMRHAVALSPAPQATQNLDRLRREAEDAAADAKDCARTAEDAADDARRFSDKAERAVQALHDATEVS